MIDLANTAEVFTIEPLRGIVLTVRPGDSASVLSAQESANRRVQTLLDSLSEVKEAGLLEEGVAPDLSDKDTQEGLRLKFLAEEMAIRHVIAWEGVEYRGKPAPLSRAGLVALMGNALIGPRFLQMFNMKQLEQILIKKDFGPAVTGTSAADPSIAPNAANKD